MNRDEINNAVAHYYPASPYMAKAALHLRHGSRIVYRIPLCDEQAVKNYLEQRGMSIGVKKVVHHG